MLEKSCIRLTRLNQLILVLEKSLKKGTFPNENALFKLLYLRIKELENKWENGHIRNWSMVLNQLMIDDHLQLESINI